MLYLAALEKLLEQSGVASIRSKAASGHLLALEKEAAKESVNWQGSEETAICEPKTQEVFQTALVKKTRL